MKSHHFGVKQGLVSLLLATGLIASGCQNAEHNGIAPDETTREGDEVLSEAALEVGRQVRAMNFQEPKYTDGEKAQILAQYAHLDSTKIVPTNLLQATVLYYHYNLAKVSNKTYITVVDFTKHSSKSRFYIVNMKTGAVQIMHVSHGSGSDPSNTGYATRFSNVEGSNASSVGYFLTAETYSGKHGRSLRIDGLSTTNSNVRERAVVIHGADYVYESNKQAGRSWGCFALNQSLKDAVITKLMAGSIMYAGVSGKK